MTQRKPTDPESRMGVFKQFEDVPTEHRLERYADRYEGRDVWDEWAIQAMQTHTSERYAAHVDRTWRSWKSHLSERSRHHALATPEDVETWAETILERCNPCSAYQIYFTKLEAFYAWLQFHTAHPHCYHPVLMAAADGSATATIWAAKIERRDR